MFPYPKILFCLAVILVSCGVEKRIVDRPIVFDDQRVALTKEYLKNRYLLERDSVTITPQMIVLHH
ncbi:MAG: N-acetylmuramoyl-L-alanine amidase, partial [Bacteroidota bacterium]